MEIELIGNNIIDSKSSSQELQSNGIPQNAAFMNIIPNFTGSGTLEIEAILPFAFENSKIKITGNNFTQTDQTTEIKDVTEEVAPAIVETNNLSKNEPLFFDTTAGIVLLISVPSVLIIIIIFLIIALIKKSKKPQLSEQNNPYTNLG